MDWLKIRSKLKFLNRNFFISLLIISIVIYISILSLVGDDRINFLGKDKITITASLSSASDSLYLLKGRVFQQNTGKPIDSARVWVTLVGEGGNDFSPPSSFSDYEGEFFFKSLPKFIGVSSFSSQRQTRNATNQTSPQPSPSPASKNRIKEINVSAFSDEMDLKGDKSIIIESTGLNPIAVTPLQMSLVFTLFVISIIIPFLPVSPRFKYSWSIILAFLFSLALIVLIWFGIRILPGFAEDDVFLVGIGSIYKGTYDTGVAKDWLFSLTSPTSDLDKLGFGVPLWVVLLSVIGSSLYTLSIIVSEILNRPDFSKLSKEGQKDDEAIKKFRGKLENIVRHQFYMLFSPIGAIFIYQLLVMAKAADQPITVAIAALGSGLTLNFLLDKAVSLAKDKLKESPNHSVEET